MLVAYDMILFCIAGLGHYAKAGISEYWIVDPEKSLVTVLVLDGSQYRVSQECQAGETARSLLLDGLTIRIDTILALGKNK